jgi:hypothetical protein
MNAANRRKVGGYIWNAKMAELHQELDAIRETTDEIVRLLENGRPSIRLLLSCAAQIALHLNAAAAALRDVEEIVRDGKQ